jgi:pimeloyl-ACP methyl ester carboxylesterase
MLSPARAAALLACSRAPVHVAPARVVVLGGTRTARDVLDDLDVRACAPLRGGAVGGRVHCGFRDRAARLWEADAALRAACAAADARGVALVGWSLGGGVGVCLAARLHAAGVRVREVHLFGAPRVGDAAFAAWYARAGLGAVTTRYETPRDPVPRLPRGAYVPVGRAVRVPCDAAGWWAHHDLGAYRRGLAQARVHVAGSKSSVGHR